MAFAKLSTSLGIGAFLLLGGCNTNPIDAGKATSSLDLPIPNGARGDFQLAIAATSQARKLPPVRVNLEGRVFHAQSSTEDPPESVATDSGDDAAIGDTGTDPRDFAPKFMPYYRYTELENGLEQQEVVAFGLFPFSKRVAMTYEIPLAVKRDIRGTDACDNGQFAPGAEVPGGGIPLSNALPGDGDCEETGLGDMNLRLMARVGSFAGGDWLLQNEFWLPTATEDVLGSEQFQLAPGFTYVRDLGLWPAPGAFAAFMNFYQFDVFGEGDRDDVSFYKGRWFFMLPLHPSGIYALPEIQPIYDFEAEHFSLWIGPEVGKLLAPGNIVYLKPGFGIDPDADEGDRDFTLEVGYRYFF